MNVKEYFEKSEYSKIDFGSNPELFSKKELIDFAEEYYKYKLVEMNTYLIDNYAKQLREIPEVKTGIELITQERNEQILKHKRSIEDDKLLNNTNQLSEAAAYLAWKEIWEADCRHEAPAGWDLQIWQKMHDKPYKERLIIAGALIAAELDRLNQ